MNKNLPISAAGDVGKKYGLERVVVLAVSGDGSTVHTVTWGINKDMCAMAALDGGKVRAMLEGVPDSLETACQLARKFKESI